MRTPGGLRPNGLGRFVTEVNIACGFGDEELGGRCSGRCEPVGVVKVGGLPARDEKPAGGILQCEQHIEGSVVQRNTGPTRVVSVRALLQLNDTWTLPEHPG